MKLHGYRQCNGDHTLFFQHFPSGGVTILIVYVDEIIITGNDNKEARKLESHLTQHFEVKNLGPLKYFLGIEIAHSKKGLLITQQKYRLDLLDETKHLQCHTNDTPIEVNHNLTLNKGDPRIEMNSYQKLVSKLLYLSHT